MHSLREPGKWFAGLLFLLVLLATMVSLQLFQATAEGPAKRTLERSIIALTEVDVLLDRDYDDLQERAAAVGPDETVRLAEYPIDVPLAPVDVKGKSRDEIRTTIVNRSVDLMYDRGSSVWRDGPRKPGAGTFTVAGLIDRSLGFLRDDVHAILAWLTFALAALSALAAALLVSTCRGFGRAAGLGAVVLTASLLLLLTGVLARVSLETANDGEYVERELSEAAIPISDIPIRNGIAFAALGGGLLMIGFAGARWSNRRDEEPPALAAGRS